MAEDPRAVVFVGNTVLGGGFDFQDVVARLVTPETTLRIQFPKAR